MSESQSNDTIEGDSLVSREEEMEPGADTDDESEEDYSDDDDDSEDGANGCELVEHCRDDDEEVGNKPSYKTYINFNILNNDHPVDGAIIDSGVCNSVVGSNTLNAALGKLQIDKLINAKPLRPHHQFGTNYEKHTTVCQVHFSFWGIDRRVPLFDIQFDVINGDLPFLVGLPSLVAMKANLNFSYRWLGCRAEEEYLTLELQYVESHIVLPFKVALQ